MIFQAPPWSLRPDEGPENYGFVRNRVVISPKSGPVVYAFIVVPTELFQLFSLIFSEEERTKLALVGAEFYLDDFDGRWIFGVESVDGEMDRDLWPYIQSKTPPWVDLALRGRRRGG